VPGRGTRVRFEMTLKKDDEEPGEGEEAEEEARVLLVEDHATVRDALLSMFEEETGLEVVGQAEVHNRNVDRLCLKHPARLG
jgi:DNA-binding NarL/FixJ family response regulator